ncbi:MAG: hypothetical protein Q9M37_08965 [Desulfonauticus sp.]|nr:hypothetical protein [Desulfonauticus sp.]
MDEWIMVALYENVMFCCVTEKYMPRRSWRYFQAREKILSFLKPEKERDCANQTS